VTNGMDMEPALSADGSKVAFVRNMSQLFVASSSGGSERAIVLDNVRSVSSPSWSPNGAVIAFGCEMSMGWFDICVVNADGSGFRRLTADPWNDVSPAWSPDGTRLAISSNRDDSSGQQHIAVIQADGTGFTRLTPGYTPAWSPDGTRIALAKAGLWVINANGTGLKRLTTNESDWAPSWRP